MTLIPLCSPFNFETVAIQPPVNSDFPTKEELKAMTVHARQWKDVVLSPTEQQRLCDQCPKFGTIKGEHRKNVRYKCHHVFFFINFSC
jgi:hypothetical protein